MPSNEWIAEAIFPIIKLAFKSKSVRIWKVGTFLGALKSFQNKCPERNIRNGQPVICIPEYDQEQLKQLRKCLQPSRLEELGEFPEIYAELIREYSMVAFSGEVPKEFDEIKNFVMSQEVIGGYKRKKKRKSTKRKSAKRKSTKRKSTKRRSKQRKYKKTRRRRH